jgi:hypothetical protein
MIVASGQAESRMPELWEPGTLRARSFDRFLVFGDDASGYEADEPGCTDARVTARAERHAFRW